MIMMTYEEKIKAEAQKIVSKYFWRFGDGYLGIEHFIHAQIEIDGRIEELKSNVQHINNEIYYLERLNYLELLKTEIENL